jgi:predicted nucleotide-binding protein (sugar kinase/HSP70/actin superfamily)
MRCLYRTRPYEAQKGSANALYERWNTRCLAALEKTNYAEFSQISRKIVQEFDTLPIIPKKKPRVGIVGEILVKYHPGANRNLVELLEAEGAEAVVPDLLGFFLYTLSDASFGYEKLGQSLKSMVACKAVIKAIEYFQKPAFEALRASQRFEAPPSIDTIMRMTEPILQIGNNTGEGWFLTGEMLELIHSGVSNILCLQPFACLPNHVTGKGMIKKIRELHPEANIAPIDYDPGASEVNQLNRIKLMLSVAFKQLHKQAEIIPFNADMTAAG